ETEGCAPRPRAGPRRDVLLCYHRRAPAVSRPPVRAFAATGRNRRPARGYPLLMTRPIEPPPLPPFPPPLPSPRPASEGHAAVFTGFPPPLPDRRDSDIELGPPPLPRRRRSRSEIELVFAGVEWLFGLACVIGGLAVLAALPVLQFLSLGYLLEAGGRVARSGRFRDGFIGIYRAALLGAIVLGCWLLLLPARLLSGFAHAAHVIDPGGRIDSGWRI